MLLKKNVQLQAKIDRDLQARLEAQARAQDRSISWIVRRYICAGLEMDERKSERTIEGGPPPKNLR